MAQGDIHFERRAVLENISLDIDDPDGHEAPVVALGIIDNEGHFNAIGALSPLPVSPALPPDAATQTTLAAILVALHIGDQLKAASLSITPATDIPANRTIGKVTLDGPTAPTPVNINFASSDPQTIIAAPSAGNRIRITSLWLSCSANMIVLIKSGANTIGTISGQAFDKDWVQPLRLGEAEAFVLDSDIATQTYGQVCYYVEAV